MDLVYLAFFVTVLAGTVRCYCPLNRIHSMGGCSFQVECINAVRGVSIPPHCVGQHINIELKLIEAVERFDAHLTHTNGTDFLQHVTSFSVEADWKETTLVILEYMPRLTNLYLNNDQIEKIHGAPFYHHTGLQYVDLSRNRLKNIEDLFQFESQPSLEKLFLAHNEIECLPGDTFAELMALKELDLSYNRISDLDEEPFYNLTHLEILKLNNNRIKDLNGAVNDLVNLKQLYLRGNQIHSIDESSLEIIFNLEIFDMSSNQLNELKPIVFARHWQRFGSLCKIILSENQITSIPNGTTKVTRHPRNLSGAQGSNVLTEVDLSNNDIKNVEFNAFQSIAHMLSLDLSGNKLKDFIVNGNDVYFVKKLNLSNNLISNLYFEGFSSMRNLENLDLSHNMISYIPYGTFMRSQNLQYVNLTHNVIKKLDHLRIGSFRHWGVLDLSDNDLAHVSIPMDEGLRLTTLILHSNDIHDAMSVNLMYQNELKNLIISKNKIEYLNGTYLRLPYSLTTLDLSANRIQEIGPSVFHRLGHLKVLRLDDNKLHSIEYGAFEGLISLSDLHLSNNQIQFLDSKVLMDLKSLSVLSLRHNGLYKLDYYGWFGHQSYLRVYLEGNSFTCEWLSKALQDYHKGISKMSPIASHRSIATNSIEGISCAQKNKHALEYIKPRAKMIVDEILLATNQKMLEEMHEQTSYLRAMVEQLSLNSVWLSKLAQRNNN